MTMVGYELCILKENEFKKFIASLDKNSLARLVRDIDFLKRQGKNLRMPMAKKISKDLFELRTSGKQKIRIIYTIKVRQIYVLHWFIKKSQKIPNKELKTALSRLTSI